MENKLSVIRAQSEKLQGLVTSVLGDSLDYLDRCVARVSEILNRETEMTNEELDKILMTLPICVFNLSTFLQQLEIKKGTALAQQDLDEAEATLSAKGTAVEKKATGDKAGVKSGLIAVAYKSAQATVQTKVDATLELLASAKKVHARRLAEYQMSITAGRLVE